MSVVIVHYLQITTILLGKGKYLYMVSKFKVAS